MAQVADLDGDGVSETLSLTLGFHPDGPVVGRVEIRSGADGSLLLGIDGPTAGDAFAFSADFVPDMDGDGLSDLAVSSPRASHTTDRVGRVYVYSSGDGHLLHTLLGKRGDRLGFYVGQGTDLNLDGVPDIEVDGMALIGRGLPAERRFVFSGVTGEMLFDQTYPLPGVQEVLVEPIESWGDLNDSEALDGGDLAEMLDLISQEAGPESGGDLNQDDAVNYADLGLLGQAIADGHPPVTDQDYVLAEWQWNELKTSMDAWTLLYPEDVIAATTRPNEWRGQSGSMQWWIRGHLRGDGARLISGWMESDDDILVATQGQRAAALGAGSGVGQGCPTCGACVEIIQCPTTVKLGEEFTVCAQVCGLCQQPLEWAVVEGTFAQIPPPPGDCVNWIVDFAESIPETVIFTVSCEHVCNSQLLCTHSDSCTVVVEDCSLDLEGCPVELREGEGATLTAIAEPPGGVFGWSIAENASLLENISENGDTFSFSVKDGLGCYSIPPTVTIILDYEKDGCHKQRVCQFEVVVDCDDDGLDDRNEGEPGSGNCPYWGVWDSDGDCLSDGEEINIYRTKVCDPDSDGDGVSDGVEVKLMKLGATYWDPNVFNSELQQDTDHDYLPDLVEVSSGVACSAGYYSHPLIQDTDGDGLWDGCEHANGWDPRDLNNPTPGGDNLDSDDDGLPDAQERCGEACTDPANPDSDGDGWLDGQESYYLTGTSPCNPDQDGDGIPDGVEGDLGTDPTNTDTDGDGMPDGYEAGFAEPREDDYGGPPVPIGGFDPLDPSDGATDPDGDGLTSSSEYTYGTNPFSDDTDGDTIPDGDELAQGSDPNDGDCSEPDCGTPVTLAIGNPKGHAKWSLRIGRTTLTMEDYGESPPDLIYPFGPGRSYSIRVGYHGDDLETCPFTRDYSYCADITVGAGHTSILVDEQEIDPDGDYCDRLSTLLGCKNGSSEPCNPASGKSARLYLPIVDLDVDSDNDEAFAALSRSESEDLHEDDPARNGKVLFVNDDDSDADGIPDFADGFDLYPDRMQDDTVEGEAFPRVVLEVGPVPDPEGYSITFAYPASDPGDVEITNGPDGSYPVLPEQGALRLWRAPPGTARNKAGVSNEGDFVEAGVPYLLTDLGLNGSGGTLQLWGEAVRPSSQIGDLRISATLDATGDTDQVRLTATQHEFMTWDEELGEEAPVDLLIGDSRPRPVVDIEVSSATFDAERNLHLDVLWSVRDELSDMADDPQDRVQFLSIKVNGTEEAVVENLAVLGDGPGTEPWQPRRFEATGTTQIVVPPPVDDLGDPDDEGVWGGRAILVHAESGPNAAGRTGWDQASVQTRWVEGVHPEAIDTLQISWLAEDGVTPITLTYSAIADSVTGRDGSPKGQYEPALYRVPVFESDTMSLFSVLQNDAQMELEPFTYSPEKYYVVAFDRRDRPHILLVTADELPPRMSGIKPKNFEASGGGTLRWRVVDDWGISVSGVKVEVVPSGVDVLVGDHSDPGRALDEGQLYNAFLMLYGESGATLLKYFLDGDNRVEVVDLIGWWRKVDVDYILNGSDHVDIQIDVHLDPFTAAQYLATALHATRGLPPVVAAIPDDDYDAVINAYLGSWQAAIQYAATGANLYLSGVMIATDTAGDIVCVVSDLADGNWRGAAAGAALAGLPLIPVGILKSGQKLHIRSTIDGQNLFTASSIQNRALARALDTNLNLDIAARYAELAPHFTVAERLNIVQTNTIWRPLTAKKCRSEARRRKGSPPPGMVKPHIQHDCPVEFQEWFLAHGVDINDPQFTRYVPEAPHLNIIHSKQPPYNYHSGGAWNATWKVFKDAENINGSGYTRDQVIEEMYRLRGLPEFQVD